MKTQSLSVVPNSDLLAGLGNVQEHFSTTTADASTVNFPGSVVSALVMSCFNPSGLFVPLL